MSNLYNERILLNSLYLRNIILNWVIFFSGVMSQRLQKPIILCTTVHNIKSNNNNLQSSGRGVEVEW